MEISSTFVFGPSDDQTNSQSSETQSEGARSERVSSLSAETSNAFGSNLVLLSQPVSFYSQDGQKKIKYFQSTTNDGSLIS